MKRCEKRQLVRAEKKASKNAKQDKTLEFISRFALKLQEFHSQDKGNLLDWFCTLTNDELEELSSYEEEDETLEDACHAGIVYLAIMAHSLSSGSNSFEDENPDTNDSSLLSMVNFFSFLAIGAALCKKGIIELKLVGKGFFDHENQDIAVKIVTRENVPDEYKSMFDALDS